MSKLLEITGVMKRVVVSCTRCPLGSWIEYDDYYRCQLISKGFTVQEFDDGTMFQSCPLPEHEEAKE